MHDLKHEKGHTHDTNIVQKNIFEDIFDKMDISQKNASMLALAGLSFFLLQERNKNVICLAFEQNANLTMQHLLNEIFIKLSSALKFYNSSYYYILLLFKLLKQFWKLFEIVFSSFGLHCSMNDCKQSCHQMSWLGLRQAIRVDVSQETRGE